MINFWSWIFYIKLDNTYNSNHCLLNFFQPLMLLMNSVHANFAFQRGVPPFCPLLLSIAVEQWHCLVLAIEITLPLLEGGVFPLCLAFPFHVEATTCNWHCHFWKVVYSPCVLCFLFMLKQPCVIDMWREWPVIPTNHLHWWSVIVMKHMGFDLWLHVILTTK